MNQPICAGGLHKMSDETEFYIINPEGGYGHPEVLCCVECILKPENDGLKQRMIEAGAKELE